MKFLKVAAVLAASFLVLPLASRARDLTVGLAASTTSMDPQFYVVGPNSAIARNIFDGLVNQDEKQRLQPALALSWKTVDDTTWEFKLRPNVKFHDGSDFTADDVVASIKRVPLASKNSPSSFAAYVKAITEVTAVDPLTVRIKTDGPQNGFEFRLHHDAGAAPGECVGDPLVDGDLEPAPLERKRGEQTAHRPADHQRAHTLSQTQSSRHFSKGGNLL